MSLLRLSRQLLYLPDGDYKYIVHARDHFGQYSWASPMESKEAINVAAFLYNIFTQFGPPLILERIYNKDLIKL